MLEPVAAPWSRDADEVIAALDIDASTGLSSTVLEDRYERFGRNTLRAVKQRHIVDILVDQFRSLVVALLVAACLLSAAMGEITEALAILAVIAINASIGFVTEWRAVRSMEALGRIGRVETTVIRDGVVSKIAADELVPGDIVVHEGGDVVTADSRLVESARLAVDESTLTGESMPVSKAVASVSTDASIADRSSMIFKGTAIARGSAKAVVVATGHSTELGRISDLVATAEPEQTPLEKRLDALAGRLVVVVIALAIGVAAAGFARGGETLLVLEVAIALAVAAIPEGLPIVATIALARGMWRMARNNALIARLSAVETLGATSVILTDKTGTLTENRMTVTTACFKGTVVPLADFGVGPDALERDEPIATLLDDLLVVASLCNNAAIRRLEGGIVEGVGDPTEVALLAAAASRDIDREQLVERYAEIEEHPFDPDTKLMATRHRDGDGELVAVKGAPEAVLPLCAGMKTAAGEEPLDSAGREAWLRQARELGDTGLRTLAIARKNNGSGNPYEELVLLGLVGLEDPPRVGVREAIGRCRAAGVRVAMLTGDHKATAEHVAEAVGITGADHSQDMPALDGVELDEVLAAGDADQVLGTRVFSRVSPEQKLSLISLYQARRHVVAMTGDGVNDAPALKKADIGVAMGIRGTAVAKEAAAMVLQDDEFGTIVEAVAQGRAIYENIRKFVVYLLSCNISEVLVVTLATLAGAPLPLLPLQILFLNLVTDVFPALALGVGEGAPGLMREKPRPFDEPILTRGHWIRIGLHGIVMALAVLAAMWLSIRWLGFDNGRAVTVSFCTLALAQVWHVFNMRRRLRAVLANEVTRNPWIWAAVAICIALILMAVYLPLPSRLLQLPDPGKEGWLLIVGMSFTPLIAAPLVRLVAGIRNA